MFWNMTTVWLLLLILFVVAELFTMALFTVWLALGALLALILYLAGIPLWGQLAGFFVVSVVMLLFIRPFAVRLFNREKAYNNKEDLIGRDVIVVSEVDSRYGTGQIIVDGQFLSAGARDPKERLPVGSVGTVVATKGSKIIVKGKKK